MYNIPMKKHYLKKNNYIYNYYQYYMLCYNKTPNAIYTEYY